MFLFLLQILLVGGKPTPLKNMKVNWDDEIPNTWKNTNMFQTTNQIRKCRGTVFFDFRWKIVAGDVWAT